MRPLTLTEDEQLLAESAGRVVAERAPVGRFRASRDAGRTRDPELWAELVALGWAGIGLSEEAGGAGMGLVGAAVLLEALGRTLAQTPMISAVMVGPLVEGVASGEVAALAWREGRSADPRGVATRLEGGRVTGAKVDVLDGSAADRFLVSARDGAGQVALCAVRGADAAVVPRVRLDHRDAADVRFEGAPAVVVGGLAELEAALDRGRVALAAEMLGGMSAALDRTLVYLKERTQFGVPIGSFQALQHRAVDAFAGVELARSTVFAAAAEPTPARASLAKAVCAETYLAIAEDAIQMHGGIGMTDEHDIGFYLKRAMVCQEVLGDPAWHRARWATLYGY